MNIRSFCLWMAVCVAACLCAGCKGAPGSPGPVAMRPTQIMNFAVLYNQNCAACHGENGKYGAAISLANPMYLALAGSSRIEQITANGVAGTLMPAFAESQGGALTDQQIQVIAEGMESKWGNANAAGKDMPKYSSSSAGDPAKGQQAFETFCARCHGADGSGVDRAKLPIGSIVDSSYLALIIDQGLRSLIIAGQPEQGMPGWSNDTGGANATVMTDEDVTNIVAWMASHRVTTPGQPYLHPS